jgi:hypothetical protein
LTDTTKQDPTLSILCSTLGKLWRYGTLVVFQEEMLTDHVTASMYACGRKVLVRESYMVQYHHANRLQGYNSFFGEK